jgi:hypothetical protein
MFLISLREVQRWVTSDWRVVILSFMREKFESHGEKKKQRPLQVFLLNGLSLVETLGMLLFIDVQFQSSS